VAGRTSLMADKALNLYKGLSATPVSATWVTLFTTNPSSDHPTAHAAVEWGPPRVRVFPNSGAGSPHWGDPEDFTQQIRMIRNVGSISWGSITLTVSPSILVGVGVFDAASGGNLLTWDVISPVRTVTDGESHTIGTQDFKIKGD